MRTLFYTMSELNNAENAHEILCMMETMWASAFLDPKQIPEYFTGWMIRAYENIGLQIDTATLISTIKSGAPQSITIKTSEHVRFIVGAR
jgi:hypothetical protein